jgi:hypothetical protein
VNGRLNLFQAAMLRWRDLHPYSAVHAIRIEQPLDAARLSTVIDAHLEARGLTGLTLDVARERFEYAGGPGKAALVVHAGGDDPLQVLQREIACPSRAMGHSFHSASSSSMPARSFIWRSRTTISSPRAIRSSC